MTAVATRTAATVESRRIWCAIVGHKASNQESCDCVRTGLSKETTTHIRHIIRCFLGGHHFMPMARRDGHNEYVCHGCGHQHLSRSDSVHDRVSFQKRPRYICSVFGHRVRVVTVRCGFTEYVCDCGHSFLKRESWIKRVKHPVTCTLLGHFVSYISNRSGYAEYVCEGCGHTFCYPQGAIS